LAARGDLYIKHIRRAYWFYAKVEFYRDSRFKLIYRKLVRDSVVVSVAELQIELRIGFPVCAPRILRRSGLTFDLFDQEHELRKIRGRHIQGDVRHQGLHEESVMRCSNPDCNRGIGLVAYRRGWFSKRRYCSRKCRDAAGVIDRVKPSRPEQTPATYCDWLFGQPI
jgi:hypothetical protein